MIDLPEWVEPVARYIVFEGLPGTLKVSAIAVVGSAVIGLVLGTLMTIHFRPLQALIRLYIEVFRGLPILVTVFIVYFGLPSVSPQLQFDDPLHRPPRSRSSSGGARRWPRRPAAPCSRSRASSTRRPRRSASAGCGATPG